MVAPRMPIHLERDLIAATSHEDVAAILGEVRRHYEERGLKDMHGNLVSHDITGNGRFRAAVDWTLSNTDGERVKRDGMIFYFVMRKPTADNPHCLRAEMVEYRKDSFPGRDFAAQLPHFFPDFAGQDDTDD